jgi:DNA replication protein DnaC
MDGRDLVSASSVGDIIDDMRRRMDAAPRVACDRCGETYSTYGAGKDGCPGCAESDRQAAEDRRARASAARATVAALPPMFTWAGFDAPDLVTRVKDTAAIAKARAALDADRVVFTGAAGLGKTALACCLLRAWASSRGLRGEFIDAFVLGAARAQHELGRGEAQEIRRAIDAQALVADDIGADKPTMHNAVADVLHTRHANMRPTIVTTGFTVEAIRQRYGDGIARRVFENAVVIEMTTRKEAR